MSKNTPNDLKTSGIILHRTNYGEADRIINLITPEGKKSVIAKGVRKPRSKLAGGIEMFTMNEVQLHFRPNSDFGILTSAKMLTPYTNILKDYDRLKLAGLIMKRINQSSEHVDNPAWFDITKQSLAELNQPTPSNLIETWFWLHLAYASGEEPNFYRDVTNTKLQPDQTYTWSIPDNAFAPHPSGPYGSNEIKFLRLLTTTNLSTTKRIKTTPAVLANSLNLARILAGV